MGWRRPLGWARFLLRGRLAGPSLAVVLLAVGIAIFAPLIAPYDPLKINPMIALQPFSTSHLLGTDEGGRDVLSRLMYGARVSLLVGIGASLLAQAFAIPIGLVSGYFGGTVDNIIMRLLDGVIAFPPIILALSIVAALGPGMVNVMLAIAVATMPLSTRLVRAQTLSVREWEFTTAARSIGASHFRIMFLHVLPNVIPVCIVQATLIVGTAILAEASLSFLGIGIPPGVPSWGSMLQGAYRMMTRAPWLAFPPGIAIFLVVLSVNLLGDALRDALDPRLRRTV